MNGKASKSLKRLAKKNAKINGVPEKWLYKLLKKQRKEVLNEKNN